MDDFLLVVAIVSSLGGSSPAAIFLLSRFLTLTQILFTTYCTCAAFGVKYGIGRHLDDIPLENIPKALHFWYLCE